MKTHSTARASAREDGRERRGEGRKREEGATEPRHRTGREKGSKERARAVAEVWSGNAASAMVATRRARSNNAAPAGKKVLKDVTNARGRELPGKIQDAGPQTAPPNEGAIARRTRSSRK